MWKTSFGKHKNVAKFTVGVMLQASMATTPTRKTRFSRRVPDHVTDELVSRYLYTAGVPDPDLIIRTSGELRVSNFLIWQAAYSEWYVTPTYWPDFDKEEYRRALETFAQRDRRYGKVSSNEYEASNA